MEKSGLSDNNEEDLTSNFQDFNGEKNTNTNTNSINVQNVERTLQDDLKDAKTELAHKTGLLDDKNREVSKLHEELKNKSITTSEFETKIIRNSDSNLTIEPSELQPEPNLHNRNTQFYNLNSNVKRRLIACLNNNGEIAEDSKDIYENEFAALIRDIYNESRNNQPIAFRTKEIEGKESKVIVFGETRWRAVSWLVANGFEYNGDKKIELYAIEMKKGELDSAYQKSKLDENIKRAELTQLDYCIQIYQKYQMHIEEFIDLKTTKLKNQKPNGYALKQISQLTGKGEASLKKIKAAGEHLLKLQPHLGVYGLYLKQAALNRLTPIAQKFSPEMFGAQLTQKLDAIIEENNYKIHSQHIPNRKKASYITKKMLHIIENDYKNEEDQKQGCGDTNVLEQNIECTNKIKLNLKFNPEEVHSEKLISILKDEEQLEELFNDFLSQYM